jgi:uncharacterized protein YfdQ (DUF2303 family)
MADRSRSDADAIVEVATAAAQPWPLGDGRYAIAMPQGGSVKVIDPDESLQPSPTRKSGTAYVLDVDSLAFLWDKQALPESELFADPKAFTITAVLNADQGAGDFAGFRDHRIHLQCVTTPAWKAWTALDGQLLSQDVFAEHLEDRLIDIARPSGAEMLELAQSFEASTKVEFKSAAVISSGQRQLLYEETTAARAGQKGSIDIPHTFDLGLKPFEGSDAYKVTARFRYRIRDGHLQIGYKLERPEDVLRAAFDDVRTAASEACDRAVLVGTPPPAR